jgi:ferredoxin
MAQTWRTIAPRTTIMNLSTRMFSTQNVKFTMADLDGKKWEVQAEVGANLMNAGVAHGVPYEVACGGNAQCCTCHVMMSKNIMKA